MGTVLEQLPPAYPLQDARKNLSDIIGKALFANQSTVITRSGKNAAVVISFEDYERFRQLEDQYDGEMAMKRLAAGGKRYSLEEVEAELGLGTEWCVGRFKPTSGWIGFVITPDFLRMKTQTGNSSEERTYTVQFDEAALRDLKKMTKQASELVIKTAKGLATNPRPMGVESLTQFKGLFRIRAGNYRIVYTIEEDKLVVLIVAVADRKEVYDVVERRFS